MGAHMMRSPVICLDTFNALPNLSHHCSLQYLKKEPFSILPERTGSHFEAQGPLKWAENIAYLAREIQEPYVSRLPPIWAGVSKHAMRGGVDISRNKQIHI